MNVTVVIPNWNGADCIESCIKSLLAQTLKCKIIVVDNGSVDDSISILDNYKNVLTTLSEPINLGFAEGVNVGIRYALSNDADYIALFNNDAIADPNWLKNLVSVALSDQRIGIVTARILSIDGKLIDSTGDFYTFWGLPYPRGRDEPSEGNFMKSEEVFGASGGASLYSAAMLKDIGLFDKDYFAYYEDVDISFRAQLRNWKIFYSAESLVFHETSHTSSKIKGFGTYQTFKNLPMLFLKNMPFQLLIRYLLQNLITYFGLMFSAIKDGRGKYAIAGFGKALLLLPTSFFKRLNIQRSRIVSAEYLSTIIDKDPPLNQAGIWRAKRLLHL